MPPASAPTPCTAADSPYAVARRSGRTRSATSALTVESCRPTAAPRSSTPTATAASPPAKASGGTAATRTGGASPAAGRGADWWRRTALEPGRPIAREAAGLAMPRQAGRSGPQVRVGHRGGPHRGPRTSARVTNELAGTWSPRAARQGAVLGEWREARPGTRGRRRRPCADTGQSRLRRCRGADPRPSLAPAVWRPGVERRIRTCRSARQRDYADKPLIHPTAVRS
jgi:hypothetical protein